MRTVMDTVHVPISSALRIQSEIHPSEKVLVGVHLIAAPLPTRLLRSPGSPRFQSANRTYFSTAGNWNEPKY